MSTQPKRHARLEVAPAKDGLWFVRLRASNGAVLMTSETYSTKSNAKRAAEIIRHSATGGLSYSVRWDWKREAWVPSVVEVSR